MMAIECGLLAVGRIDPGKTIVFANAAGRMIDGVTIKQNGVSPETIRLMGMLMVPRSAMSEAMNPKGNRKPSATKKILRQR
jgi:hypothetical protein